MKQIIMDLTPEVGQWYERCIANMKITDPAIKQLHDAVRKAVISSWDMHETKKPEEPKIPTNIKPLFGDNAHIESRINDMLRYLRYLKEKNENQGKTG